MENKNEIIDVNKNYKEGYNIRYNSSFKPFANIIETDISQLTLSLNLTREDYEAVVRELTIYKVLEKPADRYWECLKSEKIIHSTAIMNPKFVKATYPKNCGMNSFNQIMECAVPTIPLLGNVIVDHQNKTFAFESNVYDKLLKDKPVKYLDHTKLISLIDDFQVPCHARDNFFKWFELRSAILINNAQQLTPYIRFNLWMSAYGNTLKALSNSDKESQSQVLLRWKNILSSFYAFLVFMFGVKPSKMFKSAISLLIKDEISAQLLETVLFPISFLFSPYMFTNPVYQFQLKDKSTLKYKQKLLNKMIDCPAVQTHHLGYLIKWIEQPDNTVNNFMLIHDAIRSSHKSTKKPKK